ncbi:uncharacterized protein [Rutidosis leptorrhynchoides]|uniref:uncharacterized protein n=1 Tax=Rutidosis leptorrhynchoides TaxID=125765 RepID=UPI003A99DF12
MWYDNLKKERQYEGKKTIKTWSKLKECMQKRFVPQAYKQDLYIQMNTLKQGSMNVVDYIREFEQLKICTNVKEAEEHTIARFIGGLNASIANQVEMQSLWTFESACKLAIQVEKRVKKKNNFKSYSKPVVLPMKGKSSMLPKHNEAASKAVKGKEHVVAGPKDDRRKCFKCHGFGHFQAQCPNQRALTLKEIEDLEGGFETEPVYDESDSEEFVAADIGEFLMVQRVMHSAETIEDKSQRENIFHSRCIVKVKVCSLIIDGGSCANAASTHMVEKLELISKKHPHPYKLQWLNQDSEITFTFIKPTEIPRVDHTAKNDKTLFMTQAEVDTELKHVYSKTKEEYLDHLRKESEQLRQYQLYAKLEKCDFFVSKVVFLGYVVFEEGISLDSSKVEAIRSWPSPSSITEVRSFHGLASSAQSSFESLKEKLSSTPILALPNFDILFELECDASDVGIGAVLVQGKIPVAYFIEKLNGSKLNYNTYDKEFYAIIPAVDHWSHYLKPRQFVFFSNQEALKYINGQHKLNPRHAKWVEFLQMYSFVSKHKAARVLGFSFVKELYEADPDFAPILNCSPVKSKRDYVEQDGFLFKGSRLCIPKDSIRELLFREAHGGGLADHFGINKTLEILNEHFYWPCMDKDVKAMINRCATCFQAKSTFTRVL